MRFIDDSELDGELVDDAVWSRRSYFSKKKKIRIVLRKSHRF
jgi:hypothetical protein